MTGETFTSPTCPIPPAAKILLQSCERNRPFGPVDLKREEHVLAPEGGEGETMKKTHIACLECLCHHFLIQFKHEGKLILHALLCFHASTYLEPSSNLPLIFQVAPTTLVKSTIPLEPTIRVAVCNPSRRFPHT